MAGYVQINGVAWELAQGSYVDDVRNRIESLSESKGAIHLQVMTDAGGRGTLTVDCDAIWSLLVYEAEGLKDRGGKVW